jgi:hypothetical protein
MHNLNVQIIRFVDGSFPGWVECELVDSEGRRHLIIDKFPMFTPKVLDADSEYPTPGTVRCEVLKRYQDEKGQELVCVSTARPWSIESTEGLSEFIVPAGLITPAPD